MWLLYLNSNDESVINAGCTLCSLEKIIYAEKAYCNLLVSISRPSKLTEITYVLYPRNIARYHYYIFKCGLKTTDLFSFINGFLCFSEFLG